MVTVSFDELLVAFALTVVRRTDMTPVSEATVVVDDTTGFVVTLGTVVEVEVVEVVEVVVAVTVVVTAALPEPVTMTWVVAIGAFVVMDTIPDALPIV